MWSRSCSKVFKNVRKEAIWQRWADVNSWHEWIPNIESCRLDKPFVSGSDFTLKPKGSPAVTVQLLNVKKDHTFTGCTRFFGATMYDIYEMHQDPQGIRLTVTLKVTGPLGFLWRKLVAEKIEANLPMLLKNLASATSAGLAGSPEFKRPTLQTVQNTPSDHKPKLHIISSVSNKPKPKPKKSKSKPKSKISTSAIKKTNLLLQSIQPGSTISNRKETKSMLTATKPKLSTPVTKKSKPKPKSRTSALKKSKVRTAANVSKKTTTAAKKPTAKKTTAKKTTVKKAKPKTKSSAIKKAKPKKTTLASKKAKTKTSAAKKSTAKPKAKAKAKAKAKPKPKAKAKSAPKL